MHSPANSDIVWDIFQFVSDNGFPSVSASINVNASAVTSDTGYDTKLLKIMQKDAKNANLAKVWQSIANNTKVCKRNKSMLNFIKVHESTWWCIKIAKNTLKYLKLQSNTGKNMVEDKTYINYEKEYWENN